MQATKAVGVISKPGLERGFELVPALLDWLAARGIEARLDEETGMYAQRPGMDRGLVSEGAQLVIVLGGDGTLLAAARALGGREIPLFPVNLGGLGFLTAFKLEELYDELERALHGQHRISRRRMIACELRRQEAVVARFDALNDVVVTKAALARMIDLDAYVDAHLMCTFKADGLIVATPTGSTAYSLSAGGPIMFPTVAALIITPICPHMLTNRPVVVPDTSVIELVCRDGDGETYLTIDGQVGEPVQAGDRIVCRASEHMLSLIRPPKQRFFDVLRAKLKWGER
ncbi:MAG: NAD(+)/NADH kinase [Acidobacteria bacterium]|nr:NAD(+)/NADH kinase [Acidobacteriota bacterium]